MIISKENILLLSDNGLDFFKFAIPELKQQGNKCQNVKNPFYDDSKAGLSIFLIQEQWMFKDFGNAEYSGDVFTFAALHYNLSVKQDFVQILINISRDLNLNLSDNREMKELSPVEKQLYHIYKTPKYKAIEYQKSRSITKQQHFFQSNAFKNFPVAVVFVNNDESGFERRFIATPEELAKLNLPKTQFKGNKANTFFDACYDGKQDSVFICEGPNNALSFAELGLSAVATFGASNIPVPEFLSKYVTGKYVYLAGDPDDAGDIFNFQIAELIYKNNIPVKAILFVDFPDNKDANDLLTENRLKDFGNISKVISAEKLKELYEQVENNPATSNSEKDVSEISNNSASVASDSDDKNNEDAEPVPIIDFPVFVFPDAIQNIIFSANETLKFPVDYLSASILFAASVAIGNSVKIKVKTGWSENALLYLAIVGRAGINKSHPLSFALDPLFDIDKLNFKAYETEYTKYEQLAELTTKERKELGEEKPMKPDLKQMIVSDFTPEALNEVHNANKRGLGLYKDELAGWINEFNRYHKGGDQQFWLSNWSGKAIKVNRKSSKPIFIAKPFISVCGTIQTAILDELSKDKMNKNGFTDRILFVFPDDLKKPYFDENEIPQNLIDTYKEIIIRIKNFSAGIDEDGETLFKILDFAQDAKDNFIDWQNYNADLINDYKTPEPIKSMYSKLDVYISRFALILSVLYWACGDDDLKSVKLKAVTGAINLVEYFRSSAIKVNHIIENATPSGNLDKKSVAKLLHDKGIVYREIGRILGIGKSTVCNWLNINE